MLKRFMDKSLRWFSITSAVLMLVSILGQSSATSAQTPDCTYGDIPVDEETYQQYLKPVEFPEGMPRALPTAYDARDEGIVTPAKNQASCGGCWAFASAGAIESHLLKEGLPFSPTDLSEQQQLSCNSSMLGCCGGSMTALRYWETLGPVYDTCFPFGDSTTICPSTPPYSAIPCSNGASCPQLSYRVENYYTVASDQFNQSLYVDGPSYWRFTVYSDFSSWYNTASSGSVYVNGDGTSIGGGHAVLLIGWDDSKGAYLMKNSWGATSGPQGDGTFWIAYSGHNHDLGFGMANFDIKLIKNYLPLVMKNAGSTGGFNGDFELGHVSWTESSSSGNALITSSMPVTPHSGSWLAKFGENDYETDWISQVVTVPSDSPELHYWYWIPSADTEQYYDYFRVKIGSTIVRTIDLYISTVTTGWVEDVVDLSAYAGTSVTLMFEVTTDVIFPSTVYLDDVSFQAPASGFNSQFTSEADGWEEHVGDWNLNGGMLYTYGLADMSSSVSYAGNFTNFDYEVEMWRYGAEGYANRLIIRGTPNPLEATGHWYNEYTFQYTRSGSFSVFKRVAGGSEVTLQGWTSSTAINTGDAWNTLRVVADGSTFYYYINGTLVWSGTDTSLSSGRVGIGMYLPTGSTGDALWVDYAVLLPLTTRSTPITDTVSPEQQALNDAANLNPVGDENQAPME